MVNTLFSKVLGENEKCFLFLRICLQCRRPQFDSWVGKIPLEKGKATDSSILAWRIPWTEEPGGLQSTVSQRVGHNWVAKHSTTYHKVSQHVNNIQINFYILFHTNSSKSEVYFTYITCFYFSSMSHSVMSDSLWPHELQHTRPPCPSPTPRVYSNSCPLSRWCHPTLSSSVILLSSCPQSLPASGSFPMSQLFTWGGQSIGVSASASVLPMNTRGDLL